jgi:hypothetical protein
MLFILYVYDISAGTGMQCQKTGDITINNEVRKYRAIDYYRVLLLPVPLQLW